MALIIESWNFSFLPSVPLGHHRVAEPLVGTLAVMCVTDATQNAAGAQCGAASTTIVAPVGLKVKVRTVQTRYS
jgi:hypothetical protein